ncbi:hypothetical protein [Vibrio phage JSF12]|uniref:Uncharacterized protein n=1 Tax=Vibrio phage JSF12 TaxID=1983595 RepID=A0A2D0YM40_9CAUD|nr:hypothetical protein HOS35_gp008 [Vibrio phage JSF12]ASV43526.1 hypothetical protein [Vibrio phage JSF12]
MSRVFYITREEVLRYHLLSKDERARRKHNARVSRAFLKKNGK